MDIRSIISALLIETKQDALARELGVSQSTISRWLDGQEPRGLMIDKIREAAAARGLAPPATPATGDIAQLDIFAGMGNGGLLSVEADSHGAVRPEFLDGHWTFPASVKASMRHLKSTYALPVIGDSMAPTLPGGSVVFVDTTHKIPSPADIYAVDYGDGLMVKRIELVPQSENIRVISDNERYSTYTMSRETVLVYGRVVAWFQWRG